MVPKGAYSLPADAEALCSEEVVAPGGESPPFITWGLCFLFKQIAIFPYSHPQSKAIQGKVPAKIFKYIGAIRVFSLIQVSVAGEKQTDGIEM